MDAIDGRSAGTLRTDIRDAATAGTGDNTGSVREAVSGNGRCAVWPPITRLASIVPAPDGENSNSTPVSGGGRGSSRPGHSDGGALGLDRGAMHYRGFAFTDPVPRDGYRWWYVDALSDNGVHGLTIIAFVGSVFSPYYKWRRRQGPADPMDHCAMNVALYGPGARRWTMTERPSCGLQRTQERLKIGPSSMTWDGTSLVIDLREIAVPWPSPVRGRVRVTPQATFDQAYALDAQGLHRWQPIAPPRCYWMD